MPTPSPPPRDLVAAIARCRRGRRHFLPHSIKQDIVAFATHRKTTGVSVERTAITLGLPPSTLYKWVASAQGPRLVPVITSSLPEEVSPKPAADVLSLECPGGFVVRGLNVASAANLLRALS